LTHFVSLSMQLVRACVQSDAINALNATGQHLLSARYIGRRFLVNGVDIARSLADSILAFQAQNFTRFGGDIGTALRKILLSNANRGTKSLPEGMPQKDIIQQATEGLMAGFFVKGSGIRITDTVDPKVNINLDLNRCVTGNSAFFKQLWTGLWHLVAQLATNGDQHDLGTVPGQIPPDPTAPPMSPLGTTVNGRKQPRWTGELMIALLQFPMAMQKCGIDDKTQRMFARAVSSLRYVKLKAVFPRDKIQASTATGGMARAVKAWTNWQFRTFGKEIGTLLRQLIMLGVPPNSIDTSGQIMNAVVGLNEQTPIIAAARQASPVFTYLVSGCALSILVALVAVRSIFEAHREPCDIADAPFLDMEMEVSRPKSVRSARDDGLMRLC